MKKITIIITSLVMALLIAGTVPAQVFADSVPEYISEVKIGMGKDSEDAAAALAGFKILSDEKGNPVDINQKAGGGAGSKGDKVVYIGYKTTTDRSEAVTDLALMNMKGGYSVKDYEYLMGTQIKSQIIPFVENFIPALREYRENWNSENEANRVRARFVNAALNKFTDDDCAGKGLGDLLLNKTKYELGMEAYEKLSQADKEKTDILKVSETEYAKLSAEQKNNCADIVTIIAQSNGESVIAIQNLVTRAGDSNEDTWLDRLTGLTYFDLLTSLDVLPTDAEAELDRLYQSDAVKLAAKLDEFKEEMLKYDDALEKINNADKVDFEGMEDEIENFDTENAGIEEFKELVEKYYEYSAKQIEYVESASIVAVHTYLENTWTNNGTLLAFLTGDSQDLREFYPIIASLSEGQKAGLEFVSIKDLVLMAEAEYTAYDTETLKDIKPESIYKGVDRDIYKKGGVALTSDALRQDAALKAEDPETFSLGAGPIVLYVLAGVSLTGFVGSAVMKGITSKNLKITRDYLNTKADSMKKLYGSLIDDVTLELTEEGKTAGYSSLHSGDMKYYNQFKEQEKALMAKSTLCNKLMIGFTIAMVVLTAVATIISYVEMVNFYKVEFTPIPHYMVDEKDITAYDGEGNRTVLKNQAVYYKAVQCNRNSSDEFYNMLGTCADVNGDVGRQWLALYVQKNEALAPILADSLIVRVNDTDLPAGYSTGIHMFGSGSAFNLNSELYDWNKSAPGVFVYFKVDTAAAKPGATGAVFTLGNLALAGTAGLGIGAIVSALAVKAFGKKKKNSAAA